MPRCVGRRGAAPRLRGHVEKKQTVRIRPHLRGSALFSVLRAERPGGLQPERPRNEQEPKKVVNLAHVVPKADTQSAASSQGRGEGPHSGQAAPRGRGERKIKEGWSHN